MESIKSVKQESLRMEVYHNRSTQLVRWLAHFLYRVLQGLSNNNGISR